LTTVILADDHQPLREAFASILADAGFDVVGQAGDAAGAVRLARRHRPAVCLLDISMPGDGIEAARLISAECPQTAVVMLTVLVDDDHLFSALRAGARGYLVKGTDPEVMVKSLHSMVEGEPALSPGLGMRILERFGTSESRRVRVPNRGFVQLSPREAEVLDLLRQGLSTSVMAQRLSISAVTVRTHISALCKKLDVADRDALRALFAD
jgi:DNA-binding NarL/FixJ family response regulator